MTWNCYRISHRHRKKLNGLRCTLDGVDVTTDCFYADTRAGTVRLYLRNAAGRAYLLPDRSGAAWVERHGRVRFARVPA